MPLLGVSLRADPLFPGGQQTFTSSGTFNVPPGISVVTVRGKGLNGADGSPGSIGGEGSQGAA